VENILGVLNVSYKIEGGNFTHREKILLSILVGQGKALLTR